MTEKKTDTFRFRIEPSLLQRLQKYAKEQGLSAATVIRMLIRDLTK